MSFPPARFRKTAGLRTRPVPELSTCIVFTPTRPQLFRLNPHAWMVMELADGRTEVELAELYRARTVPPLSAVVAERHLKECMTMLMERGILETDRVEAEIRG